MKLSKSKLALAKVINENGGWVDGAKFSSQDKDGNTVCFYSNSKPTIPSRGELKWNSPIGTGYMGGCDISASSLITNWHQTTLSREEYYQAYPKADADGWIDHNGKSNPVGEMDVVDVLFGNGQTSVSRCAGEWNWSWGGKSSAHGFLIEKYRLSKPLVKPEFCESVTRSIPEPDVEAAKSRLAKNLGLNVDAKPTIEQLAQDYRNAKDYAERLQKEAGDAAVKAEEFAVEIRKKILELQELIG